MNNVSEKNKRLVLDAKTLLLEFLAAVTHGQAAAALFAEDGAVELPFLHSVGIPWLHRGRQAISELQDSLAGLYLDFAFKLEDTHVLIDTPEQVFAEYMAHTTAAATGRTIHHLFTARLVAENGRIKLLRESLNPVAVPRPPARRCQGPARSGESDLLGPPRLPELRPSRVLYIEVGGFEVLLDDSRAWLSRSKRQEWMRTWKSFLKGAECSWSRSCRKGTVALGAERAAQCSGLGPARA
jgi:ketosteroid isomerase-like protein